MKTLIWRIFKKSWSVQVALMFLLASAITVLAIYGSYIEREKGYMSRRIEDIMPPGTYLVKDDPKTNPKGGSYVALVAGWRKETVPTNYGDLPITFLDFSGTTQSALPLVPPGSASFHSAVATRYGIEEGDLLVIPWGGRVYELVVNDVASELTMDGTGLGGRNILVNTGEQQMNTRFLYRKRYEHIAEATIIRSISYDHMRGEIATSVGGATVGSALINANYNAITQSKLILVIFLSVAFLTAKLLGYLESRKMLAILKALGMKGKEVAGTFAAEALIAPALGMLLGGAVSTAILYSLSRAGLGMSPSLSVIVVATWLVVPAVVFGIVIPARLAHVSAVNELLYERPVPLFREKVSGLRRRYPQLDSYVSKGVQFLKYDVINDVFEGLVFRKLGDIVQAGEVLVLEINWWGMKEREYVSPISGEIVYFNKEVGLIGVAPKS